MAVYQGARPRIITLPGRPRIAEGPALERRRARTRRSGPAVARIASDSSSPASSSPSCSRSSGSPRTSASPPPATTSAASRSRASALDAKLQDLNSDLNRLGREPAIRKQAIDNGLGQLDDAIVLPAR